MTIQTISKWISVQASADKCWQVLVNDRYNRSWYATFGEGLQAVTDWQQGSKVIFKDASENGIIGRIVNTRPGELLEIEYEGILKTGLEDYSSTDANAIKGGREVYRLAEQDGSTTVSFESDMSEEYVDYMSGCWDKAIVIIKDLAEKI